ncbi:MAG: diguanylate cyclase [Pseudooceanicola sp.]|nr:diguanylate cyclase [Pseudooceanicola sp.]
MVDTEIKAAQPPADKIVELGKFRPNHSLSPLRQAEAYWTALRNGGGIPYRTQIDPRGLENLLEYAFILERIAPEIARFRLAGQHLIQLAGMEVRGMPASALFTPAARNSLGEVMRRTFDGPSVTELSLCSEDRRGRPQFDANVILLPLKSDLGDISRCLGVLVSNAPAPTVPCRFDITGTIHREISGLRYDTPEAPETTRKTPGFADPQRPLTRPERKRPYLWLVKS